jgi:hypothetical protein
VLAGPAVGRQGAGLPPLLLQYPLKRVSFFSGDPVSLMHVAGSQTQVQRPVVSKVRGGLLQC